MGRRSVRDRTVAKKTRAQTGFDQTMVLDTRKQKELLEKNR
jgi:hypothetical protein